MAPGRMSLPALEAARREAEERLRASERQFASAFAHAPIGMALVAPDGRWLRVNRAVCELLGYPEDELLACTFQDVTHPEDLAIDVGLVQEVLTGARVTYQLEKRYLRRDGSVVWVLLSVSLVRDDRGEPLHFISQIVDITGRRRLEEELRENARIARVALAAKEVLLQEVHHRVKNNLQVVSSLVNMQIRRLESQVAIDALEECRARVLAIALIHEKLYQAQEQAAIRYDDYVRELVAMIASAAQLRRDVAIHLELAPVALPVDRAIPCGLVLNELLTNCLKHAFPGNRTGTVVVGLAAHERTVRLAVRDDGVGLPPTLDIARARTLGLQLVSALAAQIGATIELAGGPSGTGVTLSFLLPETA